jgi:hypothetical protein
MTQCIYSTYARTPYETKNGAHVDEAVVEVEAGEAGRDARIGDPSVLDDAPDDVVCAGARLVVELGAQRRRAGDREMAVGSSRQNEQDCAVRGEK